MNLNEASTMSTEDKMRAWAQGTRKENIKACGDAKLNDFMRTLSSLALDEAHKNNASLAKALTSKLLDIANEHHARGNTSDEQTARVAYKNVHGQVDSILKSKNTQYQFAKNAFSVFQKLLVDNKGEFDSMIETVDSLDSVITCPSWVSSKRNAVKDLLDNYLYKMTEDEFYKDFVVSHKYLRTVIDNNNCIAMDNSVTPCNYTEFGERMFATYYLVALLAAQAAILGRKIMAKYSSEEVYCAVTTGTTGSNIDIDLSVSGPRYSIARCSIKIYFGDIRNTSLTDLQSRKVTTLVDYGIYTGHRSSDTMTTTSDNIAPALKEFRADLYFCLQQQLKLSTTNDMEVLRRIYMPKKPYQEIKTQEVVIAVTENYSVSNYGFKSFASICKKFMSQL